MNGLGYDDFVPRMMSASPNANRKVINVEKLTGHKTGDNVHLWYHPATMPKVAQTITDDLVQIDPANAQYDHDWLAQFMTSLGPLHQKIAEMRAKYAGVPVAFTEPVFGYMAAAIGFNVLTPEAFQKAIEDGTEPRPRRSRRTRISTAPTRSRYCSTMCGPLPRSRRTCRSARRSSYPGGRGLGDRAARPDVPVLDAEPAE